MPSASQRRSSSPTVEGMPGAQTTQPALTLASAAVRSSTDLAPPPAAGPSIEHQSRQLKRLRRIEGQARGLQKMIEDDRCCADIMTQISSVHEALRAVGRELVRNHVRRCTTSVLDSDRIGEGELHDELIEMMYKLSR